MSSPSTVGRLDGAHEVAQPQNADVLLGRGKRAVNWEGNVRFRNLVKQLAGEYDNTSDPHNRDAIANQVMASISETGGRFLQGKDRSNAWVVISETSARTKVKQALRDVTKMSRTKKKRSVAVLLRKKEVVAEDLEPRPIEEMVRSASTSQMASPTTSSMLLHQQLQLRRQQSMPDQLFHALPHHEATFEPRPLSMYHPLHQPDFRNILRRQQDILSGHLAVQDVRLQQRQQRQQYNIQQASGTGGRLLYDPVPVPSDRIIEPTIPEANDLMIGQAATAALSLARRPTTSTVLLDEALQAQLNVDQIRRGSRSVEGDDSVDDQSTLGSFLFDDDDGSAGRKDDRKPPAGAGPSSSSRYDHA